MKTRYFIFFSFKGTYYHGWQVQPNNITVQQVLDDALSTVLNEKISTIGAGRTDSGVHAKFFCAHFDSNSHDLALNKKFIYRLNSFLPKDISVFSVKRVENEANARYSAISRTYKYYITRIKDPFAQSTSWFIYGDINISAMNSAAQRLFNHNDFTSFSRLHSGAKTNICKIHNASWIENGDIIEFTIKADRFLRNMVRAIVGTMVDIGFNKITPDEIDEIINACDRCKAGKSAPAKGLFLVDIEYPEEIFFDINQI